MVRPRCIASLVMVALATTIAAISTSSTAAASRLPVTVPRHQVSTLRKLLQSSSKPITAGSHLPKSLSSCTWNDNFPASCRSSMATVFAANASTISADAYGARAQAFVRAADLHCKTFSNKTDCSWPCQWDNLNTCMLADQPRLTAFDCPDSPARVYMTCPEQPRLTKPWCLATPGCSYVPQPSGSLRACEATLYANMTPGQRLDFGGPGYFVRMPREILGCCKASTFRYTASKWCTNGTLSAADCNAIQGCKWGSDGSCLPTAEQQVALLFADSPADPLNAALQAMATECGAITSPSACNTYKPVAVDVQKVMAYLDQDLDLINTPIADEACVLPSDLKQS